MISVAFICTRNACRSQIAEAFAKKFGKDVFISYSAGTEPAERIDEEAMSIMRDLYDIDMRENGQRPKKLEELPAVDGVVTMDCGVRCPYISCTWREDWNLEDPTGKEEEDYVMCIEQIKENILRLKERIQAKRC